MSIETTARLIESMPEAEYRAAAGVPFSQLHRIDRSPAHTLVRVTPTAAMELGSAAHVAILEPERFDALYAACPRVDRRTKAGKAEAEAFEAANAGKRIIDAADHANVLRMREAVYANPMLARYLRAPHVTEASMFWTDELTGLALKGRADWISRRGVLLDLKTSDDASVERFERSMATYHYHAQLAYYADGLAACGVPVSVVLIVAVEKEPPYGVAVYAIDEQSLDAGRIENRQRLKRWAECEKAGQWPGYPPHVQTITLPMWKLKQVSLMNGDAHE